MNQIKDLHQLCISPPREMCNTHVSVWYPCKCVRLVHVWVWPVSKSQSKCLKTKSTFDLSLKFSLQPPKHLWETCTYANPEEAKLRDQYSRCVVSPLHSGVRRPVVLPLQASGETLCYDSSHCWQACRQTPAHQTRATGPQESPSHPHTHIETYYTHTHTGAGKPTRCT